MHWQESNKRKKDLDQVNNITGNFGTQFGSAVYPSCGYAPYRDAMSQDQQQKRQEQAMQVGYEGYRRRQRAGF